MKKFEVPLFEKILYIYTWPKEWAKFSADTIEAGANEEIDAPCPGEGSGRAWGSLVWVYDKNDTRALIHEIVHYITDTMNNIGTSCGEVRAYMTEWLIKTVLEWALGKKL